MRNDSKDITTPMDASDLQKAYELRGVEIIQLRERVSTLEDEIAELKELLKLQKGRQFGRKNEASDTSEDDADSITVRSYKRTQNKRGKRFDTSQLPRYTITHKLSDEEKVCGGCANRYHYIGEEVSEEVSMVPSRYYVIEHVRKKYACRTCDNVIMAAKPALPLPKITAGAGLLTDIIVNKYHFHLPLYRQAKIMSNQGLAVPDNTLGNWVMKSGEALMKIYDAMWCILKARYLQVDETPVKILEPNKKGYAWTYYAPHLGNGLVVFEFSESRSGKIASDRLTPFKGLLQTDAYAGYNQIKKRKDITGFGCLTHARRMFSEVVKMTGKENGIAKVVIGMMKPLYALESRMRSENIGFHTRKRLRQKKAWPVLKEIKRLLIESRDKVPPKCQLGKAISYTLNQWQMIIAYCRHGMVEIDTNYVENKIREIALGRKNWLFIKNEESGKIHALFFSLVLSCIINKINPRVYLHYLLTIVHELRRGEVDPYSLLPHRIDCDMLGKFAEEQIAFGTKILSGAQLE